MFKKNKEGKTVKIIETETIVDVDILKKRIERKEEQLKVLKEELKEVEKLEKSNKKK